MLVYAMQGHNAIVSHKQDFRVYKQCEKAQLAWLRLHKNANVVCKMKSETTSHIRGHKIR